MTREGRTRRAVTGAESRFELASAPGDTHHAPGTVPGVVRTDEQDPAAGRTRRLVLEHRGALASAGSDPRRRGRRWPRGRRAAAPRHDDRPSPRRGARLELDALAGRGSGRAGHARRIAGAPARLRGGAEPLHGGGCARHPVGQISRREAAGRCELSGPQASRLLEQVAERHSQLRPEGARRGALHVWRGTSAFPEAGPARRRGRA